MFSLLSAGAAARKETQRMRRGERRRNHHGRWTATRSTLVVPVRYVTSTRQVVNKLYSHKTKCVR
jgi:putative methionine-R-sulfoxide reductase with GAF domain